MRIKRRIIFSEIFKILGDKCSVCGISDKRVLQIDHVDGDGYWHRKIYRGMHLYRNIFQSLRFLSKKYQLLCANCNFIKAIENGERGSVWN